MKRSEHKELNMRDLNQSEIFSVNGGTPSEGVGDFFNNWGYKVGYAYGYFYNNVVTSNNWIDDLAEVVLP